MTKEEYEIEGALHTLGVSLDYEQARKQELLKKYCSAKYLDVTLDQGFKRLLKNEAAMVSFLNAIRQENRHRDAEVFCPAIRGTRDLARECVPLH